jgi:hypothetical protein
VDIAFGHPIAGLLPDMFDLCRVVCVRRNLLCAAQIREHVLGLRRSSAREKSSTARKEPTFSATAAAMKWVNDTPSVAANSAAAFFTDVVSFNG